MGGELTIVVSGMLAADSGQGGASWAVLQYILGLRRLGHRVLFVEPLDERLLEPASGRLEDSVPAAYFRRVARDFGLAATSALLRRGTRETVGLPYDQLREVARRADVVINISGLLDDEELLASAPIRVYVDLDPAFNQVWHGVEGIDVGFPGHTHFVTVGRAIGEPDCAVPTCGLRWIATVPPVVMDRWPRAERISRDALTTVANWRGYGSVEYQGVFFGQKAHSLRRFFELPKVTDEPLALALAIHPDERPDLDALERNGWKLLDPSEVAATPAAYGDFVRGSKAEFGIAKDGYVASRCGWFSDRSACYLASGRPVIAQDTGFSRFLPTGEGLFSFETVDDVLTAIERLRADYTRHSRAARSLAEEHFDSAAVLSELLRNVGTAP